MRTVVLAYHEIGAASLKAAIKNGLNVVAVFTHRDTPSEGTWFASVARIAAEHGIPVFAPDRLDHPIWLERIRDMKPELLLSFHYRNMGHTKERLGRTNHWGCRPIHRLGSNRLRPTSQRPRFLSKARRLCRCANRA